MKNSNKSNGLVLTVLHQAGERPVTKQHKVPSLAILIALAALMVALAARANVANAAPIARSPDERAEAAAFPHHIFAVTDGSIGSALQPVPLPAAVWLAISAFGLLGTIRRRRP